jgi:hypothetical protein
MHGMKLRSSVVCLAFLGLACARSDGEGSSAEGSGETDPTGVSATDSQSGDGDGDGDQDGDGDGDGDATATEATSQGTDDGHDTDTGDTGEPVDPTGGPIGCQMATCHGKIYECGDCVDNDGDGLIDMADPGCWGPCDNNEAGWKGEIPGQQDNPTCERMTCYWDGNSGHGESFCMWSHACDPLEPMGCTYDENAHFPEPQVNSCASLFEEQPEGCLDYCGPYIPNGCDCFGCCEIHVGGEVYTAYVGTEDEDDNGTCKVETAHDPEMCHPCTPVESCFNPCVPEDCEICIGQTEVPEGCEEATCPEGIESCNPQNGHADCPESWSCITGCCYPPPM